MIENPIVRIEMSMQKYTDLCFELGRIYHVLK